MMGAMELPGYESSSYGQGMADVYDLWFADVLDTGGAVARLLPLARAAGGPAARVLELGVGTGRLALPLASAGLRVTGIDASAAMLDGLRAKPGATDLRLVEGDMADVATSLGAEAGPFDLVYVAWNSLFNLTSEEAQRRCLAGVDGCLAGAESRFVVEAFVPGPVGTERRDTVEVRSLTAEAVVLAVSRHDPVAQEVTGQYVQLTEAGGVRLRPWYLHYLTPDQLDTLADGAGLVLQDRWADWAGAPFDPIDSPGHVSVYRRA